MFDVWGRFEMRVADLRGLKRGLLRLAVASTAKYVVPDLLGLFCAQYPEIDVRMELASRSVLLQRMREAGAPVGEVIEGLADRARLFID